MKKTNKKKRELIQLYEGCYCSQFSVFPSNWKEAGASLEEDWYIFYRFYDPAQKDHPKYKGVKPCYVKGMNSFSTLGARRDVTADLLVQEKEDIVEKGWNPITRIFMKPEEIPVVQYVIHPDTGLCVALQQSFDRLEKTATQEIIIHLRSVLKYVKLAAVAVRQDKVPISKVNRSTIIMVLDQVGALKGMKWTPNNFNYYRAKLMMLFKELVEIGTLELNPVMAIRVRTTTKKIREVLQDDQRLVLNRELRADNYRLWLIMHLFFHSGARTTEFMRVKASDVNLTRMTVKYLIKKGRAYREVERPIKEIALNLWEQVLAGAEANQYLFSVGLKPGDKMIRREQITRRWRRWVKNKYNGKDGKMLITADWYSLKHLNTTQLSELYDTATAARLNAHSERMTIQHYDVNNKTRADTRIRQAGNTFAPVATTGE